MALQEKRLPSLRDHVSAAPVHNTPGFLSGGGELGALIRGYDWSLTPLSDPHTWPRNLQTAIRILLASPEPVWIGWGPELLTFYNDSCKTLIGDRHPSALGKPAAEVWRESEARFRNMAEHAPVMMWMTDTDGSFTYLNQLWSEFTGQSPEEALGYGAWMAIHPEDRAASREIFRTAIMMHEPFSIENRLRRYDGTYRWALSIAAPRFAGLGEDGPFLGYIGSIIDISERKEAEHILQRTNEVLGQRVAAAVLQVIGGG
jgi:PAS domain S-box-containing protein